MAVAIITGATKGIGKAVAEKFLQNGLDLAVCSRTYSDLEVLQTEWKALYPDRSIYIQKVDVQNKPQLLSFAKNILDKFKEINVLVNNAGIFIPGNLLDEEDGDLEKMIEVNLYSAYYLSKALIPQMVSQGFGHIFNLSSIAATQAYPNGGSYSISKFALQGLSENLRYELHDKQVKVTTVTPGAVYTDSWKGSGVEEERIMKAGDIAEMIWAAYSLSSRAVVENIILRPQKGDL